MCKAESWDPPEGRRELRSPVPQSVLFSVRSMLQHLPAIGLLCGSHSKCRPELVTVKWISGLHPCWLFPTFKSPSLPT